MIVYVETNFILELALEQEQHQVANEILELVESGKIELAFPGFSISESLSKVTRQRIERDKFYNSLIELRRELKRSALYQQLVIDLDPVQALLQEAIRTETDRMLSVLERILKVGRLLELDISSFSQALTYKDRLATSTEDSIIYGIIISDLRRRPDDEAKLFLSRDEKAFGKDGDAKKDVYYQRIKIELADYGCKYIKAFKDGLGYIESELRKAE
jgi:predicted nucleic acid-binding protein